MLETSNFVHGSAIQSLSLVVSECFLSGRGQGHVSNFYIVDLENFATASRRYRPAGDIHDSTVVGLFMTHCLLLNLQLHTIGLVRTCRISISALLRGNWQDYYWQDASRGHSAIAELLVITSCLFLALQEMKCWQYTWSVLLYGSGTWSLSSSDKYKLNVAWNNCFSRIVNGFGRESVKPSSAVLL